MKKVDRRTFLKRMGVLGGTALGLAAYPTHLQNLIAARMSNVDPGFKLVSSLSGGMPIKWTARLT